MSNDIKLIDEHLDGELSDDSFRQLQGWLRESKNNVRQFARRWLLHSLLHDVMSERQVQADALLRTVTANRGRSRASSAALVRALEAPEPADNDDRIDPAALVRQRSASERAFLARHRFAIGSAIVVLLVMLGAWRFFTARPNVAMLTQTSNCQWQTDGERIAEGALFRPGDRLHLVEGRALITFVSGARALIEGPTELTIDSESETSLVSGALTSYVPTQAVGFAVNTSSARLVDLGTEFTVRTGPKQSFEIHVFDGLIELQLPAQGNQTGDGPLRLSEGVAVQVDVATRNVKAITYDATKRMTMP